MPRVSSLISHSRLILTLVRREVEARYRGSALGILWAVLVPLLMLSVYTFVFTRVFTSHWVDPSTSTGHYSLRLFCGLLVFNIFGEAISRAPRLVLDNVSYVKKVVFPLRF